MLRSGALRHAFVCAPRLSLRSQVGARGRCVRGTVCHLSTSCRGRGHERARRAAKADVERVDAGASTNSRLDLTICHACSDSQGVQRQGAGSADCGRAACVMSRVEEIDRCVRAICEQVCALSREVEEIWRPESDCCSASVSRLSLSPLLARRGGGRDSPVRWDRRTMTQSRPRTSLGVTGCRKEIAKMCRKNVARDVARIEMCRGACRSRSLNFSKRQQSRRLRSTLRHYNRIPPDWGVASVY